MTAFEEERIDLREKVWSFLDIEKNARFLDVGLGHTAHSLTKLVASGVAVTSLDVDSEILSLHKSNAANFVQANAAQTPFKNKTFTVSLAYFTFHEINPALHRKAVSELCRISEKIIIVEPEKAADPVCQKYQKIMTAALHSIDKYEDYQTLHYWTRLLAKNGASVISTKTLSHKIPLRGQEARDYIGIVIDNMHEDGIAEKYMKKMQSLTEEIMSKGMVFSNINVVIGRA